MNLNKNQVLKALEELPEEFSLGLFSKRLGFSHSVKYISFAEYELEQIINSEEVKRIISATCEALNVTKKILFSKKRIKDDYVAKRHAFYWCLLELGYTFVSIADFVKRDHSTILYVEKKIQNAREGYDPRLKNYYEQIKSKLNEKSNF